MLTVITTSRNDDHGYKPVERTQRHIDCLYEQANRFFRPVEYILVEWNPPEDRPPIWEAVDFHTETEYWHPRIITVPPEIHNTFEYSDRLPLYQMIAKNVALRRCRGEYILATNIDILLSDEMFVYCTSNLMRKGVSIRCDRLDVPAEVPDGDREEMLHYCATHIIRKNGWNVVDDYTIPWMFKAPSFFYHYFKYATARKLGIVPPVHTMACGDYTLLHRDDWFGLKGYPELHIWSPHIDSIFLYQAHYSGIGQVVLDYAIYHIEHDMGMTPKHEHKAFKTMTQRGVPFLPVTVLYQVAEELEKGGSPDSWYEKDGQYWIFKQNGENWGLADHDLPEHVP